MLNSNRSQSLGAFIFECVMAVLYLAISYSFLFTSIFNTVIVNPTIRQILGALLGLYGIFRVYRAIRKAMIRSKE
ncbi:hypothetical protein LJB98_04575 [Bacteroidales bacterium OttesenSCG-928-M11]|nr:hypothetical protein [Bacteroidales bacterium OttesenSCG-928-M11]